MSRVYVCTHTYIFVCMYLYMFVYMLCVHLCIYVCMCLWQTLRSTTLALFSQRSRLCHGCRRSLAASELFIVITGIPVPWGLVPEMRCLGQRHHPPCQSCPLFKNPDFCWIVCLFLFVCVRARPSFCPSLCETPHSIHFNQPPPQPLLSNPLSHYSHSLAVPLFTL